MTPAELRAAVSKSPFRPFRVHTMNGQAFDVTLPDGWAVAPDGSALSLSALGVFKAARIESIRPIVLDRRTGEFVEATEDQRDLMAAREALIELKERGSIPWEDVMKELGLD